MVLCGQQSLRNAYRLLISLAQPHIDDDQFPTKRADEDDCNGEDYLQPARLHDTINHRAVTLFTPHANQCIPVV